MERVSLLIFFSPTFLPTYAGNTSQYRVCIIEIRAQSSPFQSTSDHYSVISFYFYVLRICGALVLVLLLGFFPSLYLNILYRQLTLADCVWRHSKSFCLCVCVYLCGFHIFEQVYLYKTAKTVRTDCVVCVLFYLLECSLQCSVFLLTILKKKFVFYFRTPTNSNQLFRSRVGNRSVCFLVFFPLPQFFPKQEQLKLEIFIPRK